MNYTMITQQERIDMLNKFEEFKNCEPYDDFTKKIKLICLAIEQLDVTDKYTMLTYMFVCDYSCKELGKIFNISSAKASHMITKIKKEIKNICTQL